MEYWVHLIQWAMAVGALAAALFVAQWLSSSVEVSLLDRILVFFDSIGKIVFDPIILVIMGGVMAALILIPLLWGVVASAI